MHMQRAPPPFRVAFSSSRSSSPSSRLCPFYQLPSSSCAPFHKSSCLSSQRQRRKAGICCGIEIDQTRPFPFALCPRDARRPRAAQASCSQDLISFSFVSLSSAAALILPFQTFPSPSHSRSHHLGFRIESQSIGRHH